MFVINREQYFFLLKFFVNIIVYEIFGIQNVKWWHFKNKLNKVMVFYILVKGYIKYTNNKTIDNVHLISKVINMCRKNPQTERQMYFITTNICISHNAFWTL